MTMPIDQEDVVKAQEISRRFGKRWNDLATYEPTQFVMDTLGQRDMSLQKIGDAVGSLNLDYYAVHIKALPFLGDEMLNEVKLLQHIRTNLCGSMFVDTDKAEFQPYDTVDGPQWATDDPIGSVLFINIVGPDDAAVVCVESNDALWRVCTIKAERSGEHPVSGTREWGITSGPANEDGTPTYILYVRGTDRTTGFPESVAEDFAFSQAKKLWQSFQAKTCDFINENDGIAEIAETTCEKLNWIAFTEFVL
jgi:hypothetical protein